MYYLGRMHLVFHAKSHPRTYVYIFPDMHDSAKRVVKSYHRPDGDLEEILSLLHTNPWVTA